MPFIKRLKQGAFPALDGDKAYELVEVDDFGNPIGKDNQPKPRAYKSRTEVKVGEGLRAPDVAKGYTKNFDYHLWNKLRAEGKLKRYKK